MRIGGTTALVTGGTDGIGLEIARQLKAKGARVIVCGRRAELVERARDDGMEGHVADLSNAEGVAALVRQAADAPVAILVNNAGTGSDFDVAAPIDLDANDRAIFLNLNAPVHLIVGLLPVLRAQPEAAIVNVTSGLAIAPRAGAPIYCATKAGLRSFTMALRAQLKDSTVRVIEALPPVVDTAMTKGRVKGSKMSPRECARQIVAAIEGDRAEANVGQTKLLRAVYSVSPAVARSVMLRF